MAVWMKATLLFVALQVGLYILMREFGGVIGMYFFALISEFPDVVTGFFPFAGGFQLIYRMDAVGLFFALSLTYQQFIRFAVLQLLALMLLAPLKMGVIEHYWLAFRGEAPPFKQLLQWYKSGARIGKSIVVELLLTLGCRAVTITAMAPGTALYFYSLARYPLQSSLGGVMAIVSMSLMILGGLAGFYFYARFMPVAYCLAAQPDYGLGKVFRRGLDSVKGYEKRFFWFRFSFLLWHIVSNVSYGVLQLYLLPYLSFASFQFLQDAAYDRQERERAVPVQPAEQQWEP